MVGQGDTLGQKYLYTLNAEERFSGRLCFIFLFYFFCSELTSESGVGGVGALV